MPQVSLTENPEVAQRAFAEVRRLQNETAKSEKPPLDITPPIDPVFRLSGGYLQLDGVWTEEFEVRELTGRDEEAFSRISDPLRVLIAVLERALVRVGSESGGSEMVNGLFAADWETVLIAIRRMSFGDDLTLEYTCPSCGESYRAQYDLSKFDMRRASQSEMSPFLVVGRHSTKYLVSHPYGSTQRKIIETMNSRSSAEMNTLMLRECILEIDGKPVLGEDYVRDLPMLDRRTILAELDKRRVGPRLSEVMTKCPACDSERPAGLGIAAMFQF